MAIKYVIPEQQKKDLILKAVEKYGKIYPTPLKQDKTPNTEGLYGGFTEFFGDAYLWFNTSDKSTHCVHEKIRVVIDVA